MIPNSEKKAAKRHHKAAASHLRSMTYVRIPHLLVVHMNDQNQVRYHVFLMDWFKKEQVCIRGQK
jgi:hypothetical protein